MNRKDYRVFEGLRVATLVTFITGFINAYSFNTQGGRFASIQTGNLLYLIINFAQGEFRQSFSYLLPIFFFVLGQFFTYYIKKWFIVHHIRWHLQAVRISLVLMFIIALLSPAVSPNITLAGLAFFASIQLDSFKRVRGVAYASIMMTGNIKSTSYNFAKAIDEKNPVLFKQAVYTLNVIFAFSIGVLLSTWLSFYFKEYSLYLLLLPLFLLHYYLLCEDSERCEKFTTK